MKRLDSLWWQIILVFGFGRLSLAHLDLIRTGNTGTRGRSNTVTRNSTISTRNTNIDYLTPGATYGYRFRFNKLFNLSLALLQLLPPV